MVLTTIRQPVRLVGSGTMTHGFLVYRHIYRIIYFINKIVSMAYSASLIISISHDLLAKTLIVYGLIKQIIDLLTDSVKNPASDVMLNQFSFSFGQEIYCLFYFRIRYDSGLRANILA